MHTSPLLLLALLLSLCAIAHAQCTQQVPLYEIISSPMGVYTFNDEAGSRQIKAEAFRTADCDVNARNPTGSPFAGNLTLIGQKSQDPNGCEVKDINGVSVMDSVQAIIVKSNGWFMDATTLTLDDFDSGGSNDSWKEVAAVFGMRNGELVNPTLTLADNSVLTLNSFSIPTQVTDDMGLNIGQEVTAPGAQYGVAEFVNCPIGTPESARCRVSVTFNVPLDTIVVLYALLERGSLRSSSGAFISELVMSCGCRCRENNPGPRMVSVPVPSVPGQCSKKEISSVSTQCDVLGEKWCMKEEMTDYNVTSAELPNGNYECEEMAGHRLSIESDFTPDPNFVGGTL